MDASETLRYAGAGGGAEAARSGASSSSLVLDSAVRLERRPAPTWLKGLLLIAHVAPLALVAVGSGLLDGIESPSGLDLAKALGGLVLTVALADLVESALLAPLSARGVKLPAVLLACQGVALRSADQRMFRSWMHHKATVLQSVLIISWAIWWNVTNPMRHVGQPGATWGGRVYNGLVPNLIVCMLGVRAFFRQQWQARAFEDIGLRTSARFEDVETLELGLFWLSAVGIPVINTVVFVSGASRLIRRAHVEVELLSGVEMYTTFAVIGICLGVQTFTLNTKLAILSGNAVAVVVAGSVRAMYFDNWNELRIRRGVLCSMWAGFLVTHLAINRVIKPYWLRRRAPPGTCGS